MALDLSRLLRLKNAIHSAATSVEPSAAFGVGVDGQLCACEGRPTASYSSRVRAPFDPVTGEVVGATIQEQTRQCLRNVEVILKAAGSSIDGVVQATFILDDESDFPGMNEEWGRWFPDRPPARQGAQLPIRPHGMRISIAAIATTS
jgi:2-iminobutanoate/2-iminopropanoate deaminase